jgi:hypothetical protein
VTVPNRCRYFANPYIYLVGVQFLQIAIQVSNLRLKSLARDMVKGVLVPLGQLPSFGAIEKLPGSAREK